MANTLITAQVGPVCNQALGILHYSILMPRLLNFDVGVSTNIATGDTVNVRKHARFDAKVFNQTTRTLEIQDVTEASVPVVLDTILDVSVQLNAEEVTLDLTNFGDQITRPAMIAIAEKVETDCMALLENGVDPISGDSPAEVVVDTTDPDQTLRDIFTAVAALNQNMVPGGNRSLVVGTTLAAALKQSQGLLHVDHAGSNDTLRRAEIGRLAGTTVYESPYVADPATGYLLGEDCAVFVSRALETMGGSSSVGSFESVSLRTVIDYAIESKSSIASFDSLTGSAILDAKRYVKLTAPASP